jgi:hypothetical protein
MTSHTARDVARTDRFSCCTISLRRAAPEALSLLHLILSSFVIELKLKIIFSSLRSYRELQRVSSIYLLRVTAAHTMAWFGLRWMFQ